MHSAMGRVNDDREFIASRLGENAFGDKQLDIDVISDNFIYEALKETGRVAYALSEERPFVYYYWVIQCSLQNSVALII